MARAPQSGHAGHSDVRPPHSRSCRRRPRNRRPTRLFLAGGPRHGGEPPNAPTSMCRRFLVSRRQDLNLRPPRPQPGSQLGRGHAAPLGDRLVWVPGDLRALWGHHHGRANPSMQRSLDPVMYGIMAQYGAAMLQVQLFESSLATLVAITGPKPRQSKSWEDSLRRGFKRSWHLFQKAWASELRKLLREDLDADRDQRRYRLARLPGPSLSASPAPRLAGRRPRDAAGRPHCGRAVGDRPGVRFANAARRRCRRPRTRPAATARPAADSTSRGCGRRAWMVCNDWRAARFGSASNDLHCRADVRRRSLVLSPTARGMQSSPGFRARSHTATGIRTPSASPLEATSGGRCAVRVDTARPPVATVRLETHPAAGSRRDGVAGSVAPTGSAAAHENGTTLEPGGPWE
jgi:hypothetical protein